jgi:heme/copper-type cytochrome/quinol oxidase subunit 2
MHMRLIHMLATVGLLTTVGVTIVDAAEPSQSGPPMVIPVAADGVQRATVTLDSYSYTPNHLIVEAGKPVELTLTSVTTITPHNFIIKDPAGSLFVEQDVGAGKTVTITFRPTQPGTFPIYCDKRLWPLPSHRDKGMEGKLEVR